MKSNSIANPPISDDNIVTNHNIELGLRIEARHSPNNLNWRSPH